MRLSRRQRTVVDQRAQRMALQELGDEEGDTLVLAQIVDREHVRMLERAGGAGLLFEARYPRRVVRTRDHFHRHSAADALVDRAQHTAHPALPQLAFDAIAASQERAGRDVLGGARGRRGPRRHRARRLRRDPGRLRADQAVPGQIVEPRDHRHDRQPERGDPDQRAHRPARQVEVVDDDVRQLQRAGRRDAPRDHRAEHAAAAKLAEESRHFTWCAMILFWIFL